MQIKVHQNSKHLLVHFQKLFFFSNKSSSKCVQKVKTSFLNCLSNKGSKQLFSKGTFLFKLFFKLLFTMDNWIQVWNVGLGGGGGMHIGECYDHSPWLAESEACMHHTIYGRVNQPSTSCHSHKPQLSGLKIRSQFCYVAA